MCFNLGELPPELRVRIYKYALAYPSLALVKRAPWRDTEQLWMYTNERVYGRAVQSTTHGFRLPVAPANVVRGLLQIRRWIREETEKIFYGQNLFHFGGPKMLGKFINFVLPDRLDLPKKISVTYTCPLEARCHQL